jgi:4,5-dihydroxyphthalate decarboxylase
MNDRVPTLRAALDEYPQTLALHRGELKSDQVSLSFTDIRPANKFFKPMVREQKFDVSEIAIGTFLQAKAYGKPLVLLPATMMGRFQHNTLLCRASHPLTPAELPGKRVGVRAYAQTTGNWVRGILENEYGVKPEQIHWVVFEDGHVAEYQDPPAVERAGADKNILKMLREGELDAAIYGADLPNDPSLKSVIPDPDAAALKWHAQHGVVPINHMVCVTEDLEIEAAGRGRGLSAAGAEQGRCRTAQGRQHRLPALRPQCLPAGAPDDDQILHAAETAAARARGRRIVRRHHPRAPPLEVISRCGLPRTLRSHLSVSHESA